MPALTTLAAGAGPQAIDGVLYRRIGHEVSVLRGHAGWTCLGWGDMHSHACRDKGHKLRYTCLEGVLVHHAYHG
jgi:hypothetical protein